MAMVNVDTVAVYSRRIGGVSFILLKVALVTRYILQHSVETRWNLCWSLI